MLSQIDSRKTMFWWSVIFFYPVRPEKIYETLTYLKCNNFLYSDIEIDEINLTNQSMPLRSAEESWNEGDNDYIGDNLDPAVLCEKEKNGKNLDLLNYYKQETSESLIVNNNISEISSGEGLNEKVLYCNNSKELCFSKGKFEYTAARDVKLSSSNILMEII